jgi:hypothetical protein
MSTDTVSKESPKRMMQWYLESHGSRSHLFVREARHRTDPIFAVQAPCGAVRSPTWGEVPTNAIPNPCETCLRHMLLLVEATSPSKLRGKRVRVRSSEVPLGQRVKGQDVHLSLVLDDGREVGLPVAMWVHWRVDSRSGYSTLVVEFGDAEIDVEAVAGTEAEFLQRENELLYREVERLEKQLAATARGTT